MGPGGKQTGSPPSYAVGVKHYLLALVVVGLASVGVLAQGGAGGQFPGGGQGPLRGQARATPPRADAPRGTAVIRGQIMAADTGAPIRRAQVRISSADARESRVAATDAQGRFEIKELPAGRYTVAASKGGFVSLQYGQRRPSESGTPLELADGQALDKLLIALPRGSVLGGRITDEFGDPDSPLNLMDRVNAGCISRILSGSGGILEEKT